MSVTVSLGVAAAGQGELDVKAVIQRADEALYRAKHAGRNRICVGGSQSPGSSASLRAVPHGETPVRGPRLSARVG
jgi:hypothetical protein